LAIDWGFVTRNGEKTNVLLISTGFAWAMQGVRLIVESVTYATTLLAAVVPELIKF
jgi:hypothetical protein